MNARHLYGLIGFPLSHSFSQRYFNKKFVREGFEGFSYCNFPIKDIGELQSLLEQQPYLCGFNVTVPYKEQIIPYLDEMDSVATIAGAVNTVLIERSAKGLRLKGYNTDVYGFSRSLVKWFNSLDSDMPQKALILGSGGAAKAVVCALNELGIEANTVSRKSGNNIYKTYNQLNITDFYEHQLIINATPLGMFPNIHECPAIPYQYLTEKHFLYDLVYNPPKTLFMLKGREQGALAVNGLQMLHFQAEKAWEIWTENLLIIII